MPAPLLDSYWTMLPRLQAEEELRAIAAVAVAAGSLTQEAARDHIRALEERAAMGRERARKPSVAELAAIGIEVEEVKA